jgi:hypothetical protein
MSVWFLGNKREVGGYGIVVCLSREESDKFADYFTGGAREFMLFLEVEDIEL